MNGRYLLDTNIVIALLAGEGSVVQSIIEAREIFIPVIVLGELYYGAYRSTRAEENVAKIDRLAAASTILLCDVYTARWYGIVKDNLRRQGTPIPENDIWIAALARQHRLALVSRDRHFEHVADLDLVVW
ncbi:type II toxin-antitoxin system VapC family toxin [Rhodothermus marinus]|uniref:type II toxin-antitoxin system VapC family toxin n=1 Tax=Rhodothermus marinus TaxID=29549 RepID=UPI0013752D77|nr:type II toxin-antitoxin system VapC family toxin [Rhodothermus marinus]